MSDDPDTQVAQVIGMMRRLAVEDGDAPSIKDAAHQIVAQYGEPLSGVHRYVSGLMGFTADENTAAPLQPSFRDPIVETLVRPVDVLTSATQCGDCDDFTMFGASLLRALDIPCAFVTVAADPQAPDIFSHVYLAAYPTTGPYRGTRVPMDCSHGPQVGWETQMQFRRAEWPVTRCAVMPWLVGGGLALAMAYYLFSKGAQ